MFPAFIRCCNKKWKRSWELFNHTSSKNCNCRKCA